MSRLSLTRVQRGPYGGGRWEGRDPRHPRPASRKLIREGTRATRGQIGNASTRPLTCGVAARRPGARRHRVRQRRERLDPGVGRRRRRRRRRSPAVRRPRRLRPRGRDHERLVPPGGPARHRRHPGGALDLRHAHRARRRGQLRPVPGRDDHLEPRVHRVDHQAAVRGDLPRRLAAHSRGREEQPRRLPGPVPGSHLAAVHLRARQHRVDRGGRPAHGQGDDHHALVLLPVVPLLQRPPRDHGPSPARRRRDLQLEPHRHRAVPARRVEGQRPPPARAQRRLLALRRRGQPAPVPRRAGVPSGHRAAAAHQRPEVR